MDSSDDRPGRSGHAGPPRLRFLCAAPPSIGLTAVGLSSRNVIGRDSQGLMDTVCRASGEGHHRTTAGSVSKLTLMQLLAARWCSSFAGQARSRLLTD